MGGASRHRPRAPLNLLVSPPRGMVTSQVFSPPSSPTWRFQVSPPSSSSPPTPLPGFTPVTIQPHVPLTVKQIQRDAWAGQVGIEAQDEILALNLVKVHDLPRLVAAGLKEDDPDVADRFRQEVRRTTLVVADRFRQKVMLDVCFFFVD